MTRRYEEVSFGLIFFVDSRLILFAARITLLIERWWTAAARAGERWLGVILGNLSLVGIHLLEPILRQSHYRIFGGVWGRYSALPSRVGPYLSVK